MLSLDKEIIKWSLQVMYSQKDNYLNSWSHWDISVWPWKTCTCGFKINWLLSSLSHMSGMQAVWTWAQYWRTLSTKEYCVKTCLLLLCLMILKTSEHLSRETFTLCICCKPFIIHVCQWGQRKTRPS